MPVFVSGEQGRERQARSQAGGGPSGLCAQCWQGLQPDGDSKDITEYLPRAHLGAESLALSSPVGLRLPGGLCTRPAGQASGGDADAPQPLLLHGLQRARALLVQKARGCWTLRPNQQAGVAAGGTGGLCQLNLVGAVQTWPSAGPGGCRVRPGCKFRESVSGAPGHSVLSCVPTGPPRVPYVLWALASSPGSRFQGLSPQIPQGALLTVHWGLHCAHFHFIMGHARPVEVSIEESVM